MASGYVSKGGKLIKQSIRIPEALACIHDMMCYSQTLILRRGAGAGGVLWERTGGAQLGRPAAAR